MAKILRQQLIELFILNSPRLAFHRMVAFTRPKVHPFVLQNCDYISVDGNLVQDFIKCKICHTFCRFTKTNRVGIIQHLENMHKLHNPNKKSRKVPQSNQTQNSEPKIKKTHFDKYEKIEKVIKNFKHARKPAKKYNDEPVEVCARAQDETMECATDAKSSTLFAV